jgi:hypothetical protein
MGGGCMAELVRSWGSVLDNDPAFGLQEFHPAHVCAVPAAAAPNGTYSGSRSRRPRSAAALFLIGSFYIAKYPI